MCILYSIYICFPPYKCNLTPIVANISIQTSMLPSQTMNVMFTDNFYEAIFWCGSKSNQNSITTCFHLFYSENKIRNELLNLHALLAEWAVNATADLAKQAQHETTVIMLPAVFQQIHGPRDSFCPWKPNFCHKPFLFFIWGYLCMHTHSHFFTYLSLCRFL